MKLPQKLLTQVDDCRSALDDFCSELQNVIDDLEDKNAERESEARTNKIGELSDLRDTIESIVEAMETMPTEI